MYMKNVRSCKLNNELYLQIPVSLSDKSAFANEISVSFFNNS